MNPKGPVIGPMVMVGALFREKDLPKLKSLGVKDSKLLTKKQREDLFDKILKISISHKIIIISPSEIDEALNDESLNLNKLEAIKTTMIINELKPDKTILDCPSVNTKNYVEYLKLFLKKDYQIKAEHKADFKYLEVGASSILAKVTRDREIDKLKKRYGEFGSGCPSDPSVKKFLKENWNKHPEIFRQTWATYKKIASLKEQKSLEEF